MFEIDKNLNISSRKSLPARFIFKNRYKEWMETLVAIFQDLTESYKKFISNDGRLIGLEKNTLKIKLESLLYLLVSLLQSFADTDTTFLLEENSGQDLHLYIHNGNSYEIGGGVSGRKISERKDLRIWMNETINPVLKNLIEKIGKSLLDGDMIPSEKEEIIKNASSVLAELVYINIAIEFNEMNQ